MIAIVAVTVLIPLLLTLRKQTRTHHKHLELIVSETPPTGQTRGHSVASAVPNLIDVATTVILWSELLRENRLMSCSCGAVLVRVVASG